MNPAFLRTFFFFAFFTAIQTTQTVCAQSGQKLVEDTWHTDGRTTPKLVFPPATATAMAAPVVQGRAVADNYLKAHYDEFKIAADLSNLELTLTQESLLGTHYRYRQVLNGLPVEGADLVVSVSQKSGQVYEVYNNTYPVTAAPVLSKASVGINNALDVAWNHLRVHGRLLEGTRAELVYVPVKGDFRLVYKTYVAVEAPFGYWEHQIDAASGEVMSVRDTAVCGNKRGEEMPNFTAYAGPTWSRTQTTQAWAAANALQSKSNGLNKNTVDGSALVFDGDPRTYLNNGSLVDASAASAFTAAYVPRVLKEISENGGVYTLVGPWVQIIDFESPATAPSTTANGQWTAARGNNAFDDAMVYFHIDQSQRYIQSLGFSTIQHGSIGADSDGLSGDDNSHYIPGSNRLAFGHGGVDDDEDSDVILHEYGHAITQSIVPTWGGGDSGAIGEGFGDYWGASYSSTTTNGTIFHPEWAFSWDGHSADSWSGRWLDLTNLTYSQSVTYSAHQTINGIANYSDQLWSTPLYQAFKALRDMGYPRTDMDQIILQSQFGVGSGVKMRDLANATVNAATLLFPSGPHAEIFRQKFANQLILLPPSLPAPQLILPVGGETFVTGAVVQVQWNRNGAPSAAAARLEYSAGAAPSFSDSMENGVNGWTVSHASGTLDWAQVTTASQSPTHSWFASDIATVNDQYLRSPLISVGAGVTLSFWHRYVLETGSTTGYDGGVVEISTNGTTWLDIGTNATLNGYNATISSSFSSPIGGRRAFSGNSGGFIQTQIPLTAYAGKNVYIRFRQADDSSTAATGWYVDDVSLGQQWISIGTTPPNAASFAWTLPATPSTNYVLRIQHFASGYTDSAWVQSAPFTVGAGTTPVATNINLTTASVLPSGSFQFAFTNVPGASFTVLTTTNLALPLASWTVLGAVTEVSAGQFQFSDPQATNNPQRYYRVKSP